MVAAGASEQQKQHELEEESGHGSSRGGTERKKEKKGEEEGERERERERAKERIDEEIPSRSPRDVILFNDNGCEVDACQLGNAFGAWFLCVPLHAIRPWADGSGHLTLSCSQGPGVPRDYSLRKKEAHREQLLPRARARRLRRVTRCERVRNARTSKLMRYRYITRPVPLMRRSNFSDKRNVVRDKAYFAHRAFANM